MAADSSSFTTIYSGPGSSRQIYTRILSKILFMPPKSLFHSSISYVTRYGETIFKKEHLPLVINFQNDIWIKIKKKPQKTFFKFYITMIY